VAHAPTARNRCVGQLAGAGERLAHHRDFRVVLRGGGEMLPVATSASVGHVPARWCDAQRRRLHHAAHATAREVAFFFRQLHVDYFVGQRAFDEHHAAVAVARHRIAAGDESLDAQLRRHDIRP